MQDLKLWRILQQADCDPTELLSLLHQLAATAVDSRCVFFARVAPLLEHDDPAMRIAALDILAGTRGWTANQKLVDRLADDHPDVRRAAVKALVASAGDDDARWGHGLFHPSAEIRTCTLEAAIDAAPPHVAQDALFLLSDPTHHALLERLVAGVIIPFPQFRLLIELVLAGRISDRQARHVLARTRLTDLPQAEPVYAPEESEAVIDGGDPPGRIDVIQWMLELFWDAPSEPETSIHDQFFGELKHQLCLVPAESHFARRFIAAAIVTAHRLGHWNDEVAQLCTYVDARFLTVTCVPTDVRRRAIASLYQQGTGCSEQSEAAVSIILASDICRRPSGQLDLWAIGGVLFLRRTESYELLLKIHSENRIIAAFWEDPEVSASLFCHPASPKIRISLLEKIVSQRRPQRPFIVAILLSVVPANGQDFLDDLSRAEALSVVSHLLRLTNRSEVKLTDNRRRAACESLVQQIGDQGLGDFLQLWLCEDHPKHQAIGMELLADFGRRVGGDRFVAATRELTAQQLVKLLDAICGCGGFPYGTELQLAIALNEHPEETIQQWARARIPSTETTVGLPPRETTIATDLEPWLENKIATCSESDLPKTLEPCRKNPYRGLCAALRRRRSLPAVSHDVCTAIIAARDPIEAVDAMFVAYSDDSDRFLAKLDREIAVHWIHCLELSMLGNAWLYRWEQHAFAFGQQAMPTEQAIVGCLQMADQLNSRIIARQLWEATARTLALYRARQPERAKDLIGEQLAQQLVKGLGGDCADVAAGMLARLHATRFAAQLLSAISGEVTLLLPTLSEHVRKILHDWLDTRGLGPPVSKRAERCEQPSDLNDQIVACTDLNQLQTWCSGDDANVASDAAMRLLELDQEGCRRIIAVLSQNPAVPCAAMLADSIVLWPAWMQESARQLVRDRSTDAQVRFLLGLNLLEFGEQQWVDDVLDAACQPAEPSWMQPEDLQRLRNAGVPRPLMPLRLALSPHPIAYIDAVTHIVSSPTLSDDGDAVKAIRDFLLVDGERPETLRIEAATWLQRRGDLLGFPILLRAMLQSKPQPEGRALPASHVLEVAEIAILAGPELVDERWLLEMLDLTFAADQRYHQAAARLMVDGVNRAVRKEAAQRMKPAATRSEKLRRVAETFAWGIPIGRELTGRVFTVEMIGDEDLGYTRLNENRISVSPLPILRQAKHGREIVEGLILHEYGHHMYHRGVSEEKIWSEAEAKRLHQLLNLVADEHLERNLRAKNRTYGDRLKRLSAFAFQHNSRSYRLTDLLAILGARALDVLPVSRLRVSRNFGGVIVDSGQLLQQLEQQGSSFSRFFRALRMGLGNRYDDPKVDAALKLFDRKFRQRSMAELMEIVYRLQEIFGTECRMLNCLDQDSLAADGELIGDGEGITNEEIQSEIRRITKPPKGGMAAGRGKASGPRWINVSSVEHFDRIHDVVRVPHDPVRYAEYAKRVQRDARAFRRYMEELGVRYEPARRRLRGRRLDRSSIHRLVLRSDPRILLAREPKTVTDLFLGVVIDCSGSMEFQENIEKAKLFGAMLAEAARGHDAIDLRLFGFTDQTIYDAGSADRPGIAALCAGGGNNDAAALYHAASVAAASRRRAKLLVMISDGLPTECSTSALKSLVGQLSHRSGLCCAQVAVQPLPEVCFPHYIELGTQDSVMAVRKFGEIVARLVRKAMT